MNSVIEKPYVLFVETEGEFLQDLYSSCGHGKPWEGLIVCDCEAAMAVLRQQEVAVVVVYCGDNVGAWEVFLAQVKTYDAMVIRLGLNPDETQVRESLVEIHQILAAQCQPQEVMAAIDRSFQAWLWLQQNPKLEALLGELHHLPSPPALYFALRDELDSPTGSLRSVAALLARDAALVARILRVANSGFYARPREITDLYEAVGLLGLDLVLGIVLTAHLFDRLPVPGLNLDDLWKHNFAVAKVAQRIAKIEGCPPDQINAAGLAGLLHDLGGLVLLANLPGDYQRLIRKSSADERLLVGLERQAWGAGHPEIGAMVLSLWNLADSVVEAVARHHGLEDGRFDQASPVARAVFLAELLVVEYTARGRRALADGESPFPLVIKPNLREACLPLLSASLTG